MLQGREVVLGVTGGIAVYKSAEVVSRLRKLGASVHVIMTKNATEFVAPLTFFYPLPVPLNRSGLANHLPDCGSCGFKIMIRSGQPLSQPVIGIF